mgnify:CR=1 FL=1
MRLGTSVTEAIQVSLSLPDTKTRKREIRGLLECCKAFGLKEGLIIARDTAEESEQDGIAIKMLTLYRWCWNSKAGWGTTRPKPCLRLQ